MVYDGLWCWRYNQTTYKIRPHIRSDHRAYTRTLYKAWLGEIYNWDETLLETTCWCGGPQTDNKSSSLWLVWPSESKQEEVHWCVINTICSTNRRQEQQNKTVLISSLTDRHYWPHQLSTWTLMTNAKWPLTLVTH